MAKDKRDRSERRLDPAYQERQRSWYLAWYERNKSTPEYRRRQADNQKKYRSDPILRERHMARWILNRRIKTGTIKPGPCEVCGARGLEYAHALAPDPPCAREPQQPPSSNLLSAKSLLARPGRDRSPRTRPGYGTTEDIAPQTAATRSGMVILETDPFRGRAVG